MSFLLSAGAIDTIPDSATAQYQYDALTLDANDTDAISSWTDTRVSNLTLSGDGTYRSTGGPNGNPEVEINTDGWFTSNELTLSPNVALIAVVNRSSLPAGEEAVLGPAGANNDRMKMGTLDGNWYAFSGGTNSVILTGSTDAAVNLLTCFYNGNDLKLREDGSQTDSGTGAEESFEAITIGSGDLTSTQQWNSGVTFAEVHQGITESELSTREQEIADYLGITL